MGHQEETAVFQVDALEGELAVDETDGNLVVGRLQGFVDTFHAVARDAGVKRGGLVAHDVTVEVQDGLRVILGRGGKSGMDTLHHGNLVVVRMRGENVDVGHNKKRDAIYRVSMFLSIQDYVARFIDGEFAPFLLDVLVTDHDSGGQTFLHRDFHVFGLVVADTQLLKVEHCAFDDATIFLFDGAGLLFEVFQADEGLLQESGGIGVVHEDFLAVVTDLELQ